MNKELLLRIRTAGEYQRKAVYALFPEEMSGHLETIEKELKMMALETVMAFFENNSSYSNEEVKQCGEKEKCGAKENGNETEKGSGQAKKARKIEITT